MASSNEISVAAMPAGSEDENEEDELYLPTFANESNRQLNREVRKIEREVEEQQIRKEEVEERVVVLKQHLKNVEQEIEYTEARNRFKKSEVETEDHLGKLVSREIGRMESELRRLMKEKLDLQEKSNGLQSSIFKGREELDHFKLLMNWNQEELEQWALAVRQKEEDSRALEKYKHADDGKIKDLQLQVEKMSKQVADQKATLAEEITKTQSTQIELGKIAEDFQVTHKERLGLVNQWEESLSALKSRDEQLLKAQEDFGKRKTEASAKKRALDNRAMMLKHEIRQNSELESKIGVADRLLAKVRELHAANDAQNKELESELILIRGNLAGVSGDVAKLQATNKELREQLKHKRGLLANVQKKFAEAKLKLEESSGELMTQEKAVKTLENVRQESKVLLDSAEAQLQEQKKIMLDQSDELFRLRTVEKDLIAEISGCQAQSKNLSAKIHQLDQYVMKQQELLYNAEYSVQQMERRVARAGGERTHDEKKALEAQIKVLDEALESAEAQVSMLNSQVKHAEDTLRRARKENLKACSEKATLNEAVVELRLRNKTTEKKLREEEKRKQETLVNHDILKLEVTRLKDLLNMHADDVYSLKNRKEQLRMTIEERKEEIELHMKALKSQSKALAGEKHSLIMEEKERAMKVHQLKSRYEIMMGAHVKDESGKVLSQAYFVIKAAQERDDLQSEGDLLDLKIQRAEKEVNALEVTYNKLVEKNDSMRKTFRSTAGDTAFEEVDKMKAKLDRAFDSLKEKKREAAELERDVEYKEAFLASLEKEGISVQTAIDKYKRSAAEADRSAQACEIERQSLDAELQRFSSVELDDMQKLELNIRGSEEIMSMVTKGLSSAIANSDPETAKNIQVICEEHGLLDV